MKYLCIPALLTFLLAGCAANSTQQGPGLYYPLCYAPLHQARQLDSRAREVFDGMGKGFLTGTLAGLAGGAVSALFTGDAMNIVSGAAIGAAGGTVAGGLYGGMNNNQAEKDALVAQWSQEVGTPLEGMGFNGAAATASAQCYTKRLEELQQEVKDGIITSQAAEPRLVEIELGRQQAYALLRDGS